MNDFNQAIFSGIIKGSASGSSVLTELMIYSRESLNLGSQKRQLSKFQSSSLTVAGFRVIDGNGEGTAYTENLSKEGLARAFEDAKSNARDLKTSEHRTHGMLEGETIRHSGLVDSFADLSIDEDVSLEAKKSKALELEGNCYELDSRVSSVPYASLDEEFSQLRLLNSHGVDKSFRAKRWIGYVYPLVVSGEQSKMSGETRVFRKFADLDVRLLSQLAVEKAVSRLGAVRPKTGRYRIFLEHQIAGTFVDMFSEYLSAKAVFNKTSLFSGKVGKKVASDLFELVDDPFNRLGSGLRPFDDEGVDSQVTSLISDRGEFKGFLTNLEYSKKLGLPHTGHAARSPTTSMGISSSNLVVTRGRSTRSEFINSHSQVLQITDLKGSLHACFNSSTGDISIPCEGFLFDRGECVGAVDQFVLSGNILELLMQVIGVGDNWGESTGSSVLCPDLLVSEMGVAGA